jgi:hypothetical protein
MRTVWRSWFWNLVIMVGMFFMAASATGAAVSQASMPVGASGRLPGMIGFGALAVVFGAGMVRSLLLGVWIRPWGVVMRALTRTTTIPWGEIDDIKISPMTSGAAGAANAISPVIVWKRLGKPDRLVELSVLGGYGMVHSQPTPQERAAAGLRDYLAQWRKEQVNN